MNPESLCPNLTCERRNSLTAPCHDSDVWILPKLPHRHQLGQDAFQVKPKMLRPTMSEKPPVSPGRKASPVHQPF